MAEASSFSFLWQRGRLTVEYIIDSIAWLTWLTNCTSFFEPWCVLHQRVFGVPATLTLLRKLNDYFIGLKHYGVAWPGGASFLLAVRRTGCAFCTIIFQLHERGIGDCRRWARHFVKRELLLWCWLCLLLTFYRDIFCVLSFHLFSSLFFCRQFSFCVFHLLSSTSSSFLLLLLFSSTTYAGLFLSNVIQLKFRVCEKWVQRKVCGEAYQ